MHNMEIFTPESVLSLMSTLIPALSRPPFSQSTLDKLGSLCTGLVKVGGHLERNNPYALNRLQVLLTNLCQDSSLDIVLRLQLLEVIELRSLGWKADPTVENYYRERISKFGAKKQNGEEDSVVELTSCIIEAGGDLLTIQCNNAGSLELARETLQQFFSKPPAPKPQVMLSRVEIMALATSPSSRSPPKNWEKLSKTLPSVVVRSKSRNLGARGDSLPNRLAGQRS